MHNPTNIIATFRGALCLAGLLLPLEKVTAEQAPGKQAPGEQAAGEQDTVIVATGREGEGRAGRRGRVLEFRGTGLVLHTAPGRKVTIPAERVIGIETERTTPHQEGDACWEEGRYQQAARHYEAALEGQREPRAWVRQQISAALIRCRHAAGEHHAAGRLFVSLLEDDPQSPYFDTIPLAWTSGQRATPQQIAPWLAHPLPAIRLLGASYGLAGGDRQQAIGVLDSLAQQPDARVRHLATAQRWRTRLARPDPQELDRWPAVIAQLPRTQRAGPCHTWGLALAAAGDHEGAALAQLQVRILYPAAPHLLAESLLAAGKSLGKLGQPDAAGRVFRELIAGFPATPAAAEAQQRLEAINLNSEKPT